MYLEGLGRQMKTQEQHNEVNCGGKRPNKMFNLNVTRQIKEVQ